MITVTVVTVFKRIYTVAAGNHLIDLGNLHLALCTVSQPHYSSPSAKDF